MAFRYINPGYGVWLNDSAVSTIENNFTYNPDHGISFTKTATSITDENKIVVSQPFTTDIYVKFNMYVGNYFPTGFYLGAKSTNSTKLEYSCMGLHMRSGYVYLFAGLPDYVTGAKIITLSSPGIEKNSLNKIQFHIHRGEDAASSFGEITINETTTTKQFTEDNYYRTFSDEKAFFILFPASDSYRPYISELIVSDESISSREKIIALPISGIQTDMTAGENGIYIANAADQILLQTPDIAALSEEYGADSKVTGISLVGNPAYKTGTALTTSTAFSKADSVITEHGTCDLSDDTDAVIQDGWSLSDTTLADLQNMQFGWKAGE